MLRVNATRAASICVFVIHARSSVCNPNSPKLIRKLREAVPLRLPRWDFRYFTRLGINGIKFPRPPRRVQLVSAGGGGRSSCAAPAAALSVFFHTHPFPRSFPPPCSLSEN